MATLTLLPDTGHQNSQGTNNHGHHHAKQKCTTATCCSPSRLWRSIQELIGTGNKQDLIQFCQDPNRKSHVLRVMLTSRLTNDASLYPASNKHRVIQLKPIGDTPPLQYRAKVNALFGKTATDLNALQLALFHRQEGIACYLLQLIRQDASDKDRTLFVNHLWGARNGSLHLACFLGMPRVVQLLLEMGVAPDSVNQKLKTPLDCCLEGQNQDASSLDCRTLIEQALLIKHGKKLSVDTSSLSSTGLINPPSPDVVVESSSDDDGVKHVDTLPSPDDKISIFDKNEPMVAASPSHWSDQYHVQVHSYNPIVGSGYLDSPTTFLSHQSLKQKQDGHTMGSVPPLVDIVLPAFDEDDDDDDEDDDDDDDYGMKYQDICWSPPLLPLDDPFPNYGHSDDDDLNHDVLLLPHILDPLGISLVSDTFDLVDGCALDSLGISLVSDTFDLGDGCVLDGDQDGPDLTNVDYDAGDASMDGDGGPKTMDTGDSSKDGDGDPIPVDDDAGDTSVDGGLDSYQQVQGDPPELGCMDDDSEKPYHPGESLPSQEISSQVTDPGDQSSTSFGQPGVNASHTSSDHGDGGGSDQHRALLLLLASMLGNDSFIPNQKILDSGQDYFYPNDWTAWHSSVFANLRGRSPNVALIDLFAETNDGSTNHNYQRFKANDFHCQLIQGSIQERLARRDLTSCCYSSARLGVLHSPSFVDAYT